MNLKGRTALMTGGAGHLGFAMAEALAEAGASMALLDLPGASGRKLADALQDRYGVHAKFYPVDLAKTKVIRKIPGQVARDFGSLDILIHCAALVGTSGMAGWTVPFERQRIEAWRKAIEINLTSVFALTQAAAPHLRKNSKGSVINVASIYGIVGPDRRIYEKGIGNPAAYSASKGGLLQLTRWLATTLAPKIRVNAISPGGVLRGQKKTFLKKYIEKTPLKRMAIEEDIKGAALYLASDLSAYVTGQNLIVDGGWTAW